MIRGRSIVHFTTLWSGMEPRLAEALSRHYSAQAGAYDVRSPSYGQEVACAVVGTVRCLGDGSFGFGVDVRVSLGDVGCAVQVVADRFYARRQEIGFDGVFHEMILGMVRMLDSALAGEEPPDAPRLELGSSGPP